MALDKDRKLAEKLDFFYYPTLYVFDRDSELRFAGGCDAQRLPEMVAEIAGEKPGAPKKMYSLTQPAAGAAAPAFSARSLDGKDVALESLRGMEGDAAKTYFSVFDHLIVSVYNAVDAHARLVAFRDPPPVLVNFFYGAVPESHNESLLL
jgi:hypothetical protein